MSKYIPNLRYTLNKDKKKSKTALASKGKQSKVKGKSRPQGFVDLNGSDVESVDGEDSNMFTSAQSEALEMLKSAIGPCAKSSCNNQRCKIDKSGEH